MITRFARRGLHHVHDLLADLPELLEDALEAEGVGEQAEPEQVAVHAVQLAPDDAQEAAPVGHLDAHEGLDALAVGLGVDARADAAHALHDLDHLW
jgi:hypothetical protein